MHRFRLVRASPIDRPKSRDRSAIDRVPSDVSRDRSHQIPRSIGVTLPTDRLLLGSGEVRDGDEPRSIASIGAIDRR